jgi:glutathione S-transferase
VKLYQMDLSPFAARCRLQIYAKGLNIEFADPPGGLGSDEYKRINPTGKVPALEVDGSVLPESLVICEYLEDRFPDPALRPAADLDRARMRLLSQLADLYVMPPLTELFGQTDPKTRDAQVVSGKLDELHPRLDQLEGFLAPGPYAAGEKLSLADCTLMPIFFFATRLLPLLGDKDPLADRPKLASWWEAVQKHEAVRKVDAEMARALAEYLTSGG